MIGPLKKCNDNIGDLKGSCGSFSAPLRVICFQGNLLDCAAKKGIENDAQECLYTPPFCCYTISYTQLIEVCLQDIEFTGLPTIKRDVN